MFSQCPKALWLRVYKPEVETKDDALQARFEKGNEVGDLAMGLFGDFKEVTVKNDGSLDLTKMIELTQQYMDEGVENICEASFNYEGNYCAVDILRKTQGGWAIYEVKSTSFPEFDGQEAKLGKYAPDIAYQKWVLTQCGINVTGTYPITVLSGSIAVVIFPNLLSSMSMADGGVAALPSPKNWLATMRGLFLTRTCVTSLSARFKTCRLSRP